MKYKTSELLKTRNKLVDINLKKLTKGEHAAVTMSINILDNIIDQLIEKKPTRKN